MPLPVVVGNFTKLINIDAKKNHGGEHNHPIFNTQHYPLVRILDALYKKLADLGSEWGKCVEQDERPVHCISQDEKSYIPLTSTLNSFTIGPMTCDITPSKPYADSFISKCHAKIRGRLWEADFQKTARDGITCSAERVTLPIGRVLEGSCGQSLVLGRSGTAIKNVNLFEGLLSKSSPEDLSLSIVANDPAPPPSDPTPQPTPPEVNSGVSLTSAALTIGGVGLALYVAYKLVQVARKYFTGKTEDRPPESPFMPQQHSIGRQPRYHI